MPAFPTPTALQAQRVLRVALLASATALAACGNKEAAAPPAPPPVQVSVLEVAPRRVPILIETVGRTEGSKEVEVRARVSGILEKQLYVEGNTVRAGAPLYRLDRAPFEIALQQAQAALAQEKSRNEQAQREAERSRSLGAQKAISQREADDAATTLKSSVATLAAAEARVREAQLNISYTAVDAPISGVTGRSLRSEGSLVTAGTDNGLLTTLTQTDPIWVRFALSDAERDQLRAAGGKSGAGAEVRLLQSDGSVWRTVGRVNFTGASVDARLGTVQLRAEFANPALDLLPGQFVKTQVVAGMQDAILVPQSAVLQSEQGRYVWLMGADGKAAQRRVEAGAWLGSDWIIAKGLNAGDKVITDNLLKLRPGSAVTVQAPGAPGASGSPASAASATSASPAKN